MGIPWTVPLLLAAATTLIVLSRFGRRLFRGTYVWRRTFWCPFRRVNVGVDFRIASWDGTLRDVNACSAYSPPLACDKGCLLLRTFPGLRAEVPSTRH